jgi:hypothetical protein
MVYQLQIWPGDHKTINSCPSMDEFPDIPSLVTWCRKHRDDILGFVDDWNH